MYFLHTAQSIVNSRYIFTGCPDLQINKISLKILTGLKYFINTFRREVYGRLRRIDGKMRRSEIDGKITRG